MLQNWVSFPAKALILLLTHFHNFRIIRRTRSNIPKIYPPMPLSLRTLLAFEDNVFDVEQHRRLEQLLDQNAEATLNRMRSVVRDSTLGVPGLVDQQEELDPNFVAEYLDHQMPTDMQARFETYCLSADKYLAEITSIHHILSNVLGEPARTSRECRLRCYDILKNPETETKNISFVESERPKHFRPFEPQVSSPPATNPSNQYFPRQYLAPLWKLLFSPKKGNGKPEPSVVATEQKSSLWTFTCIGLLVCALLLGWQQIEKQRDSQKLREATETPTFAADNVVEGKHVETVSTEIVSIEVVEPVEIVERTALVVQSFALLEPLAPIEQVAFTTESFSSPVAVPSPIVPATEVQSVEPVALEPFKADTDTIANEKNTAPSDTMPFIVKGSGFIGNEPPPIDEELIVPEQTAPESTAVDPVMVIQPTMAKQQVEQFVAAGPVEPPLRANPRPAMPTTAWQAPETPVPPIPPAALPPPPPISSPSSPPTPPFAGQVSPPILQTSGTAATPRILGRMVPTPQPSVVFTAMTSSHPWLLPPLPFDLSGEQYLLTTAPFQGTLELAAGFRIEMIGDAKLCMLPLDTSGTPGIFVDYGRIIIRPLQPNLPLRIETEKSRGYFTVSGTNSVLFIDSFAEVSHPSTVKPPEEQRAKTEPILGFVPKNGERIVWKSISQPQPFIIESQGSILLQSDQYRFCEVRLPSWLGPIPMSQEDRMLAEACRRCFGDARGLNPEKATEQALTWLMQDESLAVRALGLRLWGDLGRFDVPLTVMAEKRKEDESVRHVLANYCKEVMRRDSETVQRFADAIEVIKEARR